jgi:hypothetical protein
VQCFKPFADSGLGAIDVILKSGQSGFFVMKDLSAFMNRPDVIRALRDAYYHFLESSSACLVILSPELVMPEALGNEMFLVEGPLPKGQELLEFALQMQEKYPGMVLPHELHSSIALALRGLTLNDAGHVMRRVFESGRMEPRAAALVPDGSPPVKVGVR